MGSNYFGDRSSSSSSSSSRKGKKNGQDQPKQPQRGLGVAQLEKIRLRGQLGCNYVPAVPNPYHHHHHVPNLNQEDIRVQTAYPTPSSSSFLYSSASAPVNGLRGSPAVMMGFQDLDRGRASVTYADPQHMNVTRWHMDNAGFGSQQFVEPTMTRSFFEPEVEEGSLTNKNKNKNEQRDSESNNAQDIDLELRL